MSANISESSRVHFAMFAKYWESGKVKTRLAKSIGETAARDIHLLFVQFLLRKFEKFGDRRSLVGSPEDKKQEFEQALSKTWSLAFQSAGDLGARMSRFLNAIPVILK